MNFDLDPFINVIAAHVADRVVASMPNAQAEEPWQLLTLDEAAARLTRSTRWVRDRVKAGSLPHVRLDGGAFAFLLSDLQAFADERRVGAETLAGRLQAVRKPASQNGLSRASLSASQKARP